jgi:hypothetical protein
MGGIPLRQEWNARVWWIEDLCNLKVLTDEEESFYRDVRTP